MRFHGRVDAPLVVHAVRASRMCRGIPLEVEEGAMRKRIRIMFFAALVAALAVPVGFALSLESSARAAASSPGVTHDSVTGAARLPILAATSAAVMALPALPEGAKLLAVGTALFGLAAAMRRSGRRRA
jgi:hypothetical protein